MPYFSILQSCLFITTDINKKDKEKIDELLNILEESNVAYYINKAIERDYRKGGRIMSNPYSLFAAILYAFTFGSKSLRDIEDMISHDIRFMYIMGNVTVSYVTIAKFLNNVVVKYEKEIYSCIIKTIIKKFNIDISDCFVDGTKLEANANKYKFVYKPSKFKYNLFEKIKNILVKYFELSDKKNTFTSKEVGDYLLLINDMATKKGINIKEIKTGKGHRVDEIVKDYHLIESFILKLLEYEEKERICGTNRNSYYKTDKDATAMCLKEDYYSGLGSNMHAGYNLQIIVSKGLILDYYVNQERNDFYAFIPLIESFKKNYGFYPKRICADSGYGSYKNYKYIEEANIENYIKFNEWERLISGEFIFLYKIVDDKIMCLNNREAVQIDTYENRRPHKGNRFYFVKCCSRCIYKEYCHNSIKKKANKRVFEINVELHKYKNEATKNLISKKGIEMRVNRSCQVEGAFGVIKQDMDYERTRRRGLERVSLEVMLTSIGYVLKKVILLISGKGKIDYWEAPDTLEDEKIPDIIIKKLLKKKVKSVNQKAKEKYKYKTKRKRS